MQKKIAILGLGWLGLPLANSLFSKGHEIKGSTTSSTKLMSLLKSQLSIRIIKIKKNIIKGNWKNFITGIDALIINIPPGREGDIEEIYPLQMEQIIKLCPPDLKVVFVSSISVYGDQDQFTTEESETRPSKISGKAVLRAENILRGYFKSNLTILRLAGLFGENRHPGRFLKTDKPIPNPNGKINLIHQDDCIQLITAIVEQECYGEIFNGCADEHPSRSEFYKKAAFALSVESPSFDPSESATGKIVDNQKSKNQLGIVYHYSNPELFFED